MNDFYLLKEQKKKEFIARFLIPVIYVQNSDPRR
jgi:hypothetical protein